MREWSFKPLSFNLPLMSLVFDTVPAYYSEAHVFRTSSIRVRVRVTVPQQPLVFTILSLIVHKCSCVSRCFEAQIPSLLSYRLVFWCRWCSQQNYPETRRSLLVPLSHYLARKSSLRQAPHTDTRLCEEPPFYCWYNLPEEMTSRHLASVTRHLMSRIHFLGQTWQFFIDSVLNPCLKLLEGQGQNRMSAGHTSSGHKNRHPKPASYIAISCKTERCPSDTQMHGHRRHYVISCNKIQLHYTYVTT